MACVAQRESANKKPKIDLFPKPDFGSFTTQLRGSSMNALNLPGFVAEASSAGRTEAIVMWREQLTVAGNTKWLLNASRATALVLRPFPVVGAAVTCGQKGF